MIIAFKKNIPAESKMVKVHFTINVHISQWVDLLVGGARKIRAKGGPILSLTK